MKITQHLKRHKGNKASTVLHTRMYLAVSAGLNRIVSVRNTVVTHDGRYPLRFQHLPLNLRLGGCYVFGLSSPYKNKERLPNKDLTTVPYFY